MPKQHLDFYESLRKKILAWADTKEGLNNKWAKYILIVPDIFHLLCKLTLDPEVPVTSKAKLLIALAYFISPIDLIPEAFLGPLGYTDDLVITALALNMIINETDPYLVQKHWAGEEDVLALIKRIIETADQMIGRGLVDKIKVLLSSSGR